MPPPRPRRRDDTEHDTDADQDPATTAAGGADAQPVGAYLSSITVEGFRGVGPAQTLTLQPGRGLTVVAGRNGSGKSSFAEGLEVLLTGSTSRFQSRAVFRDGWRNLHRNHPTRVRAEFHVDSVPGTTVVERTWADGTDLGDSTCTVQVASEKVSGLERLGWDRDLATYKPFLAHSDLGAMFDGKPSELYDRLAVVLGLGELTAAQEWLADHRKALDKTIKAADAERKAILAELDGTDDERAARVRTILDAREPDLDALGPLVVGSDTPSTGGVLDTLRGLAALPGPDPAVADTTAARLSTAADGLAAIAGTEAARARSLADLLGRAVALHDQHPADTDCPVCGRASALDAAWREHATDEIARLQHEADAAERAHREATAGVQEAERLVSNPPAVLHQSTGGAVDTSSVVDSWKAWAARPSVQANDPDNLRALAEHLGQVGDLAAAVDKVRAAAAAEMAAREDRWAPIAQRVAAWIDLGRAAAAARPTIKLVKEAEAWLKAAHDDIRNERLRPIAERAQTTWQTLRHESNVDLGVIRLAGSSSQRRLVLDATVDGSDGSALGVMSQGEVNALALSVFLPRATLPESPFRFLVIDDPVQAMDPAKVDGLGRVLHEAAQTHQVIVFTHDDRLPNALRRLDLDARIVQVQRRPGSIVEIVPAGDPVSRALGDARAVARDDNVPEGVKRRVVPGQCRLALEAALSDITVRRELAAGRAHHEVDALLDEATTLHKKAALALFGNPGDGGGVLPRLDKLGRHHVTTFKNLNAGAHGELTGSAVDTVKDTQRLIDALAVG
jgi:energy-coupling factor transporter ATP-binding protein EcfA2